MFLSEPRWTESQMTRMTQIFVSESRISQIARRNAEKTSY